MYGVGVVVLGLLSAYMNVRVCQGLTAEEISQFGEEVQVSIGQYFCVTYSARNSRN